MWHHSATVFIRKENRLTGTEAIIKEKVCRPKGPGQSQPDCIKLFVKLYYHLIPKHSEKGAKHERSYTGMGYFVYYREEQRGFPTRFLL